MGRCFAYIYNVKKGACNGYAFNTNAGFTHHEECGANLAVDVMLPDPSDAMPSVESYTGCSFRLTDLGVAPTKEKCEDLCLNCEYLAPFVTRK